MIIMIAEKDVLCVNCGQSYKESEQAFKKSFYKNIGKENWCDDCVASSEFNQE